MQSLFFFSEPSILLDRDLVGELKDIWQTIQSQREKEKFLNESLFYEAFGPSAENDNDDSPTMNAIPNQQQTADVSAHQEISTTSIDAEPEVNLNVISNPDDPQEDLPINPVVESDYSVNPYLVPYPQLDNIVYYLDNKSSNDTLDNACSQNDENNEKVCEASSLDVCANETTESIITTTVESPPMGTSSLPTTTVNHPPLIPTPTTKSKEKQPSNNQQSLESFKKKSIEFLTTKFFTFRTKSNNSSTTTDGNNSVSGKKGKEPKDKNIKNSCKQQSKGVGGLESNNTIKDCDKGSTARDDEEIAIKA